jgi:hypothetical protein
MKLTEEQLAEVRIYIFSTPRFRETYNELYDHIVNALEEADSEFSIGLVQQIVKEDFGGFEKIAAQEEQYQKQVTRKYKRLLGAEMLNTFKFPTILSNICALLISIAFYVYGTRYGLNIKPMYRALYIISLLPLLVYVYKRFFADRKHIKLSIKYDFLHHMWLIGQFTSQVILFLFVQHWGFTIPLHIKLMILSFSFFTGSVFIRAFIKLYKQRISVLAV